MAQEAARDAVAPVTKEATPIDFIKLESSGTLSDLKGGALGKTVWAGQPRSEILIELRDLPTRNALQSLQLLKKNILLTRNDASLIENDIPPKPGFDILTSRLRRLMDSGFYEDALTLYRTSIDDPYHEVQARIGILLIIYNAELPTACLEEKVLAPRYEPSRFWQLMDAVCDVKLGNTKDIETKLKDSEVLKAIFTNPALVVPAEDESSLLGMTGLERSILMAEGRLDFSAFVDGSHSLSSLHPLIFPLFLKAPNLPEKLKLPVLKEALTRGLVSEARLKKADPVYGRLNLMDTPEEQWETLAPILSTETSVYDAQYFSGLLELLTPEASDPALSPRIIAAMLLSGQEIPAFWTEKLMSGASQNYENYAFLQALKSLGVGSEIPDVSAENFGIGLKLLSPAAAGQVLAIIESLDKADGNDHNPLKVYEKEVDLTSESHYVMHSDGLMERLKTAESKQQTGLVVLSSIQALSGKPEDISPETLRQVLDSLQAVGLIEEARQIAREWLAILLTTKKEKGE